MKAASIDNVRHMADNFFFVIAHYDYPDSFLDGFGVLQTKLSYCVILLTENQDALAREQAMEALTLLKKLQYDLKLSKGYDPSFKNLLDAFVEFIKHQILAVYE